MTIDAETLEGWLKAYLTSKEYVWADSTAAFKFAMVGGLTKALPNEAGALVVTEESLADTVQTFAPSTQRPRRAEWRQFAAWVREMYGVELPTFEKGRPGRPRGLPEAGYGDMLIYALYVATDFMHPPEVFAKLRWEHVTVLGREAPIGHLNIGRHAVPVSRAWLNAVMKEFYPNVARPEAGWPLFTYFSPDTTDPAPLTPAHVTLMIERGGHAALTKRRARWTPPPGDFGGEQPVV